MVEFSKKPRNFKKRDFSWRYSKIAGGVEVKTFSGKNINTSH